MRFSSTIVGLTAVAVLAGVAIAAPGPQNSHLNRAPGGVEPMSPGGTRLGSATLFAVVNADGTTNRGDGNAGSTKLSGLGTYEVLFRRNIVDCAFVATIGLSGFSGSSAPGEITVQGRAGTTNGLFIQTFNSAGQLADRGFHVFVNC